MTRKPILSASKYETFELCELKGYFNYIEGVRDPGTPATQVGSKTHTHLENYLEKGTEPDLSDVFTYEDKKGRKQVRFPGQLARAAIPLLPPPGVTTVEGKFSMRTPVAEWRGARDGVTALTAAGVYVKPAKGLQIKLLDHKTTGNATYAMTGPELQADTQGLLYAWELMESYETDTILGQWTYILTDPKPYAPSRTTTWWTQEAQDKWDAWVAAKKPAAWKAETVYTYDHVRRKIVDIDQGAKRILQLYEEKPGVDKVRYNLGGCSGYGGCYLQNICPRYKESLTTSGDGGTFWDRLEALDEKEPTAMTDKLSPSLSAILAKHHEAKGEAVPAALLPPAPPPPPPAPKTWEPGDPLNQTQQGKLALRKSLMEVALAADFPPELEAVLSWGNAKKPYADVIADLEAAHALEREALAKIKAESLPPPPPPALTEAERIAANLAAREQAGQPTEVWEVRDNRLQLMEVNGTPIGVPERGFINSPEGPAVAFTTPQALKEYQEAQDLALGLAPPPPVPVQSEAVSIADGQTFEPYTDRDQAKKEAVRLGLVPENSQLRLPKLNEILGDFFLKGLSPEMTEQSKELSKKLSALPPPPKAPSFAPGAIASRVAPAAPASGYLLFVGAFPVKGSFGRVVHFSEIATAALKAFQEKWNQPLPGFIDYKGNDYFAHEIEKELSKYGAGDVIYVDPRGREASAALSRLEQYAAAVVKGGF